MSEAQTVLTSHLSAPRLIAGEVVVWGPRVLWHQYCFPPYLSNLFVVELYVDESFVSDDSRLTASVGGVNRKEDRLGARSWLAA